MNESYLYLGLYLMAILVSAFSQLLLKISANKTYSSPIREYLNPYVIVAYGFFFLSTFLTMLAMKYIPLSTGPVLDSLGVILVPLLGCLVLKEKISKRQLVGMAVIMVGVFLFNL
ncbi:MAG: SMR family transporter [Clostridiales bacterium]|nr:SMR family transporter [Clostridiales bacterium]